MCSRNDWVQSGEQVYVLAEEGEQYIAYAAVGSGFAIELPPGIYQARRYDPRTGQETVPQSVSSGVQVFEMPDAHDWAAYCVAQ